MYEDSFKNLLSIFSGIHPALVLLEYMVIMFKCLRNCHTVSIVAVPFRFPTSNAQGFQFLYIVTKTCFLFFFFLLFENSASTVCEVVCYCVPGFILFGYVGRTQCFIKI